MLPHFVEIIWSVDLKGQVVAETLNGGETVNGVAQRYDLIPSTVSDWRRLGRQGKLALFNLDGLGFVPVVVEEVAVPVVAPVDAGRLDTLDIVKGDVVIRLAASILAGRIAEIVTAL